MKARNRYVLVLAVVWGPCLVLSGAAYALVLQPRIQYGRELEARVSVTKERYARARAAAEKSEQARLTAQVASLRQRVADFLVGPESTPNLAFAISEMAHQMQLESFGMKPASKGGYHALPDCDRLGEKRIEMSFSATFPRFAAFVNALERHRPVLFVETFAINRPVDGASEPQVNMELAALVEKPPAE